MLQNHCIFNLKDVGKYNVTNHGDSKGNNYVTNVHINQKWYLRDFTIKAEEHDYLTNIFNITRNAPNIQNISLFNDFSQKPLIHHIFYIGALNNQINKYKTLKSFSLRYCIDIIDD